MYNCELKQLPLRFKSTFKLQPFSKQGCLDFFSLVQGNTKVFPSYLRNMVPLVRFLVSLGTSQRHITETPRQESIPKQLSEPPQQRLGYTSQP